MPALTVPAAISVGETRVRRPRGVLLPASRHWQGEESPLRPSTLQGFTKATVHIRPLTALQPPRPIHDTHNSVNGTADLPTGHPGARTALQKHLSGGHGRGPRATAESWEAIGMSRRQVRAPDREGTGWDNSPGKVTRRERRKEEASAPRRWERELHPSPRCTAHSGCRQARDWIR